MTTDFNSGDRVEVMVTYTVLDYDGYPVQKTVIDDRGTIVAKAGEFTYRVALDGEDEVLSCFVGDLRLLNAADLLAESLDVAAGD